MTIFVYLTILRKSWCLSSWSSIDSFKQLAKNRKIYRSKSLHYNIATPRDIVTLIKLALLLDKREINSIFHTVAPTNHC